MPGTPHAVVAAIESLCVDAVQLSHAAREVRLRGLEEQVIVIAHHAVGVHAPAELAHGRGEDVEENQAVVVVGVDWLARVAAAGGVIECARVLEAERAGHAGSLVGNRQVKT